MSIEVKGSNHKSIVGEKSYKFALDIILLEKQLRSKNEYILSKQIMRAGTSIGANINEAQSAESKKDFVHKLNISLKEARETKYWLNLLHDSNQLESAKFELLEEKCNELMKLLISIIKTTRKKYLSKN